MLAKDIFEQLFHTISREPITFNKLCRASKLHHGTVKKYLHLIEYIQSQEKISIERKDFRVEIRKESG